MNQKNRNILSFPLAMTFVFVSWFCFSQESRLANKTLNDSVFSKSDIIRIPALIYSLSNPMNSNVSDSLKPVADFLNKYPRLIVEIGCHTDSRGNAESNTRLCKFRAEHVWNYLVKEKGIDPKRLIYKAYGESRLIIPDEEIVKVKTKEEKEKRHQINRRTELTVIDIQ